LNHSLLDVCHTALSVSASALTRIRAYVTDSEVEDAEEMSTEVQPPKLIPLAVLPTIWNRMSCVLRRVDKPHTARTTRTTGRRR
ncbi:hypothetical protein BD309DRAFT_394309, partial [Dichomitus squalens]